MGSIGLKLFLLLLLQETELFSHTAAVATANLFRAALFVYNLRPFFFVFLPEYSPALSPCRLI